MNIHLGYEIGTGRPVSIPLRHLAVTGQTQLSGKTSTLEALIARSGLQAVAFITKRGEGSFERFRTIAPYFIERTDWQSVEAMLTVIMNETMKGIRARLVRVCNGAESLAEIQGNVRRQLKAVRGQGALMYELIGAYLKIILPQIKRLKHMDRLDLAPGINVLDLHRFTRPMQSLIIRSTMEWVYEHERGTVIIMPEAWAFIPQGRQSPVLMAAEELIRRGAALRNFIWIDSQDLASVHARIRKSISVYILGVQAEQNEVNRTLDHIPAPKPTADDIRRLSIGQFFVRYDKALFKAYVQPNWADPIEAEIAARSGGGTVPRPRG